jgi:signal transduction histidine kinase
MAETEDVEEKLQYMAIVEENNDLLLQLISDILDLSKIEAGTFDFVEREMDVNLLCEDIVRAMQMKAKPGVEILFDRHLPECQIVSDRNRLNQVIANFVNNAIKFTTTGSIRVGYEQIDDTHLRFYVADTGIGIEPERCAEIFDRFVKLNSFVHGTGLGLSISKSS